jgi:hypothetical protein
MPSVRFFDANEEERKQKEKLKEKQNLKKFAFFLLALLAITASYAHFDKKKAKEKEKQEQLQKDKRAQEFADFIFDDVESWVSKNKNKESLQWAIKWYKENPKEYNKYIERLAADSAKYADAILRDAGSVIEFLDKRHNKNVSFKEAMQYIENQEALITGPVYKGVTRKGGHHGEEVVAGIDYVDTGKREVKGSNQSPARKIKINKKHLQETEQSLKFARTAKGRAK